MSSRRDFLKYSLVGVGGFLVGAGAGWTLKPAETKIITEKPEEKVLKAAWIYVGPIGDYGWTHAHNVGRLEAEEAFPWLETDYTENIDEAKTEGAIQEFIDRGFKVIFTTSFDHMNPTYRSAEQNPNIIFFHCSGYKRRSNMGTYFADLYQSYYLNGLMAGGLTKTNKIGYVAAHLIPEVIRHINSFAIGATEINPNVTVYVIEIGAWYAPDKAREAASTLVEQMGVDVLAFTEDTPSTIEYAQSLYEERGQIVPVFSHYSPMYQYGKDVVPSGQLVRWGPLYKDILSKVYSGLYTTTNLENVDYWYLLDSNAVDVGAETYDDNMWVNPKFKSEFANKSVVDTLTGEQVSLLELITSRYNAMKDPNLAYDPFTGPLEGRWWLGSGGSVLGKNISKGEAVKIPPGVRLGHDDLWNMGWFLNNVVVQE
jgi:simple sugar transport system substrate-binding protein